MAFSPEEGGSEDRLAVAADVGAEAKSAQEVQDLLEHHREVGRVAGQREREGYDRPEDREERDLRESETPSGRPTAGRELRHLLLSPGSKKGSHPVWVEPLVWMDGEGP